ncbi:MAG TPA: efflux RND transporter periplasmic adaptor subunit [Myxococcota bacterium]|nr:efflux RND transporter periplasmic adaptor subunit [Myxococcota bacterium]
MVSLFAMALLAAGCSGPTAPGSEEAGAAEEPVVAVRTTLARRGAIAQRLTASATLEARRESRIGTEVQGRIERVFVDEGDRVEAGDPLFEIDREPYEMALRQAQARLDLVRAQRAQGESDVARSRSLRERGVVAVQAIEQLETQLAVARANERQAAEAVALARHQLARTRVLAPWSGSVAARLVDEGSTALVQPQTVLLVLQESGALEARASIPESQLARLRVGDAAQLSIEGLAGPIETRVSAVSDAIDPATRTYSVRMPVANADHALRAGVFALVEIAPQPKADALLVPREAVRSEDGRTRVFTVREGRATPLPVVLGLVSDADAEILEGLEDGTPVIVGQAAGQIAPGMRVRVAGADDAS